jgi:Glycosyltransferase family 87
VKALATAYTIAAVLGAGWFIIDGATSNVIRPLNESSGDGNVDLTGARVWMQGRDPFSDAWLKEFSMPQFGHPPTTPFWFLFFHDTDYKPAHGVTGVMVLLMLVTLLYLLAVELRAPVVPATVALAFGFVVHQQWMGYHLAMMQLGIPIALLYVLAWWFLRRGRQIEGGVMLGLACTFKLFPGLMMLFLLLARRWKAFAAGAAAWLAIAIVMTSRYGIRCWPEYFSRQGWTADYWMGNIKNGSVQGIIQRLFYPGCRPHFGTSTAASLIAAAISLALVAGSWWLSRRLARDDREDAIDGPFALFAVVSVFVNPWIWEHYYVLLIFPWAVAASMLRRDKSPLWQIVAGVAALTIVVWLTTLDIYVKTTGSNLGPGWHRRTHLYEVANWLPWPILIVLLGALVFRRDRSRMVTT